ncbi:Holliday junction resolvase RusA (prophage-encoded endonuclease) [Salinibacillus kushneri]|uniref:Holliday junction resolvase RusA (Prophage-encoded endonuclease) n=1 Tax=Salinibacillus kushneri TaxID=237682 RepID=A0A1I0IDY1_9BACI|nr:RusA family crossover junction endodeoxyribonuclease [Salinibacillus kushneri]SET95101.1 Holliday junction resolvase RusA (prophage-encoded endonuclease) [Salinibacillus kushneri]
MIEFTVLGDAQAQGRPRAGRTRSGKVRMYDPQSSRTYKQYVKLVASQHAPKKLILGPVSVSIKIYRQIPKCMSKKLRKLSLDEIYRPTKKPDCSNIAKGIEDALNGVIYKDDSQIVELQVSKYYSEKPRVEITIKEMDQEVS